MSDAEDLSDLLAHGHSVLARGQQGISEKIYSLTEELQRLANEIKEDIADGQTPGYRQAGW